MNHSLRLGAAYLLAGEALLAIMAALIKHLSSDLSTEQLLWFRNVAGLFVLLPLVVHHGRDLLRTQVWHWHLLRGVVGVSAMYCYFWALAHMPLTEAFLVKLSSPLFMPLLAWLWLREPAGRRSLVALLVGFAGVVTILRPGSDAEFTAVALIGLLGAVLAALAKVSIRRMSATEPSARIVFYFGVIASLISTPGAVLNWQPVSPQQWWLILLLGLIATLGQLALTKAYRLAPTGKVGVYAYSAVIYGALMGWLIWQEVPLWTTWAGAVLIISAGIINLHQQPAVAATQQTRSKPVAKALQKRDSR
ncbi:hypothetical protein GCM10011297_01100 [Bacterioplanes sanyensis]|uniref:DMT family transporter n=1 Tax=Bacterioplanes sanyensis TaxID=1249553 RepID=UPI0019AC7EFE|nr:DMT family transporter [Bacterioplanes sanyensis]GGY32068.1 hypothetical protein GCM10011297_01100 [Bacterioplanes sanyensis]